MITCVQDQKECQKRIRVAVSKGSDSLDLSSLKIGALPRFLLQLRGIVHLNISDCGLIVPEWLGKMTWLESLDLSKNISVAAFLRNAQRMHRLSSLNIGSCYEPLLDLPPGLGHLMALEHLNIDDAVFETFPKVIRKLRALKSLSIVNSLCEPEDVMRVISHLRGLKQLRLHFGTGFGANALLPFRLPDTISELRELEVLDLGGNDRLEEIPASIKNLVALRQLRLGSPETDYLLKSIPEEVTSLPNLSCLDLSGHRNLSTLPGGLEQLTCLTELHLDGTGLGSCPKLSSVQEGQMEKLSLSWPFPDLSNYFSLTSLSLSESPDERVDAQAYADFFEAMPMLPKLNSFTCTGGELESSDFLLNFPNLKCLRLIGCVNALPERIGELRDLEVIEIHGRRNLSRLPESISGLKNLRTLIITGCDLRELPKGFPRLRNLEYLVLSDLKQLVTLDLPLLELKRLRRVEVSGCPALKKFSTGPAQAMRKKVTVFEIRGCQKLREKCIQR